MIKMLIICTILILTSINASTLIIMSFNLTPQQIRVRVVVLTLVETLVLIICSILMKEWT